MWLSVLVLASLVLAQEKGRASAVTIADVPIALCETQECDIDPWTGRPPPMKLMKTTESQTLYAVEKVLWGAYCNSRDTDCYVMRGNVDTIRYSLPQLEDSGVGPDLVYWQSVLPFLGQAYDLTPIAAEQDWASQFSKPMLDQVTFDGRYMALPTDYSGWGIMYRPAQFAALGLAPPTSWDEFLAVCEALKRAGVRPIELGMADMWQGMTWWEFLCLRIGGPTWYQTMLDGEVDFATDPINRAAWTYLQEMIASGYFGDVADIADVSISSAIVDWYSGDAAMMLMTSALLGPGVDFFPFPFPPTHNNGTFVRTELVSMSVWAVNRECKSLDVCLGFIRNISTPGYAASVYAVAGGNIPTNLAALALITDPNLLRIIDMLNGVSQLFIPIDAIIPQWTQVTEPFMRLFFIGALANTSQGSIDAITQELENARQEELLDTATLPTIAPAGGIFTGAITATIATVTQNATVLWSLVDVANGADPIDAFSPYTAPLTIPPGSWRARAKTTKPLLLDSAIVTSFFEVATISALYVGQHVPNSPNVLLYVLAVFIGLADAWTTLILTEQMVVSHKEWRRATESGPRRTATVTTLLWLALVTVAIDVAQWTSSLAGIAAIDIPDLALVPLLPPMTFTFAQMIGVLFLPLPPMALAIFVMSARNITIAEELAARKVTVHGDGSSLGSSGSSGATRLGKQTKRAVSTATTAAPQPAPATASDRNEATIVVTTLAPEAPGAFQGQTPHKLPLSPPQPESRASTFRKAALQFAHSVRRRLDRHVGFAAFLFAASVACGHFSLMSGILLPCSIEYDNGYVIAAFMVTWCFAGWGMMMVFYFRATQLRPLGAIPVTFALVSFNFIVTSGATFRYDPTRATTDALTVSKSTVIYVSVVVAAASAFLLIGISIDRLKLSRDTFESLLQAGAKKNAKLEQTVRDQSQALLLLQLERFMMRNPVLVHQLAVSDLGDDTGGGGGDGNDCKDPGSSPSPAPALGISLDQTVASGGSTTKQGRAYSAIEMSTADTAPRLPGSVYTVDNNTVRRLAISAHVAKPPTAPPLPPPEFKELFVNDVTFVRARQQAVIQKSAEQWDFVGAVEIFHRLCDNKSEHVRQMCTDIVETFIKPDRPSTINFGASMRNATLRAAEKDVPARTTFDICVIEAQRLMTSNEITRMLPADLDDCGYILRLTARLRSTIPKRYIDDATDAAVNFLAQLRSDSRTLVPQRLPTPTAWTPH